MRGQPWWRVLYREGGNWCLHVGDYTAVSPSLRGALRMAWREALSPAAVRRRRRRRAWYRSGLTRGAWERAHGPLED